MEDRHLVAAPSGVVFWSRSLGQSPAPIQYERSERSAGESGHRRFTSGAALRGMDPALARWALAEDLSHSGSDGVPPRTGAPGLRNAIPPHTRRRSGIRRNGKSTPRHSRRSARGNECPCLRTGPAASGTRRNCSGTRAARSRSARRRRPASRCRPSSRRPVRFAAVQAAAETVPAPLCTTRFRSVPDTACERARQQAYRRCRAVGFVSKARARVSRSPGGASRTRSCGGG